MDALKLRLGDVVATKHSRYCWLYNTHAAAWMFHKVDAKDLVCWCAPKACHADVILQIANTKGWCLT